MNNLENRVFDKDKMFPSYNCFISSLGTYFNILNEPVYDIKLSLHLQWQFFYREQEQFSSEQRIIGEYPYINDKLLLDRLKKTLSYNIDIIKTTDYESKDLDNFIAEWGYAIIFVNKRIINRILKQPEEDESITTVLISSANMKDGYVFCKPNFYGVTEYNESGIIKREDLNKARFSSINGHDLHGDYITCNKISQKSEINKSKYICITLLDVINRYLDGKDTQIELLDSCWYGKKAMHCFAERILHWATIYEPDLLFQRLDISAMGLIFVKRQRCVFFELIYLIQKNNHIAIPKCTLRQLELLEKNILDQWGDLRMYMRLVCYKKQISSLQNISDFFRTIAILEMEYLNILKNHLL